MGTEAGRIDGYNTNSFCCVLERERWIYEREKQLPPYKSAIDHEYEIQSTRYLYLTVSAFFVSQILESIGFKIVKCDLDLETISDCVTKSDLSHW
jgi:hypothetical protein